MRIPSNLRFSLFISLTASRLRRIRISSSPSHARLTRWKQSTVIMAFGNTFLTILYIESEKSIVTSFTFSRSASCISIRRDVTSTTLVPLTAAISVPFRPCPSLFDRNVNRSFWCMLSSMLKDSPMLPGSST